MSFPNSVSFYSKYQALQDIFFSNYGKHKKKIAHFNWCLHNKTTKRMIVLAVKYKVSTNVFILLNAKKNLSSKYNLKRNN